MIEGRPLRLPKARVQDIHNQNCPIHIHDTQGYSGQVANKSSAQQLANHTQKECNVSLQIQYFANDLLISPAPVCTVFVQYVCGWFEQAAALFAALLTALMAVMLRNKAKQSRGGGRCWVFRGRPAARLDGAVTGTYGRKSLGK